MLLTIDTEKYRVFLGGGGNKEIQQKMGLRFEFGNERPRMDFIGEITQVNI